MNEAEILSHFEKVKRSGAGYTARCPAHEDDRASLKITFNEGRVLMHCFAGCEWKNIVGASGLTEKQCFDTASNGSQPKRIAAIYDYVDADGKLVYQVVRFVPKDFRPRRPNGEWGLTGESRRPLYRLPEVMEAAANDDLVFVVEGEKDVESLRALDLTATTAGGANSWRPEQHAEPLRGVRVVVLPDNDAAGTGYAEAVRSSLEGIAASVTVVKLPGLAEHGDVTDWLAAGGTREKLEEFVKTPPPPTTEGAAEAGSLWLSPASLRKELAEIARTRVSTGIPTLDRATKGGLPGGSVTLLVGPVGSCKTAFAIQLGLARARKLGRVCYAYMPDQGGTQPLGRLAETFGDIVGSDAAFMQFSSEIDPYLKVIDERLHGVDLDTFKNAVLKASDVGAVIIDTPQTVLISKESDERAIIDRTMDVAREIASKLITHVFIPSHANRAATAARKKEERTLERSAGLGSAKLEHRSQVVLFMERRQSENSDLTEVDALFSKVTFGTSGARMRLLLDPSAWLLREIDYVEEEKENEERATKRKEEKKVKERDQKQKKILEIVDAAPDPKVGVNKVRIKEKWGGRTADLNGALELLVEDGELESYLGQKGPAGGRSPMFFRRPQTKKKAHTHAPEPEVEKPYGTEPPPPPHTPNPRGAV